MKHGKKTELEEKSYWVCQCGKSRNMPWCDGTHIEVGHFGPREYVVDEKSKAFLCTCGQSTKMPKCDGSHKDLTP